MNMAPILPGGNPSDTSGVLALLKLIQDPDAHAKRIKELQDQADLASKMMDDVRAERKKVDSDLVAAKQELATAKAEREAILAEIAVKQAGLKAREDVVIAKEATVSERVDMVGRREAQLAAREKAHADAVAAANTNLAKRLKDLDDRAAKLSDAEAAVSAREKEAIATKEHLDRRLASINAALAV